MYQQNLEFRSSGRPDCCPVRCRFGLFFGTHLKAKATVGTCQCSQGLIKILSPRETCDFPDLEGDLVADSEVD